MKNQKVLVNNLTNIIRFLLLILLLLSPFLSSGKWNWGLGWLYTGSWILHSLISRIIATRLNPDLVRERSAAGSMQDTRSWDKWFVPVIAFWLPFMAILLAGFDKRLNWSRNLPGWLNWLGLALIIFGYAISTWSMANNAFFSSYVRLQKDRGQTVVSSGPYAVVRHPAYISGAIAMCGIPLLLNSLLAFPPIILLCVFIIVRTILEDRILYHELPGYKDYCRKVRFRLIPGIW